MHKKIILVIGYWKIKYFHLFPYKKWRQIIQKSIGLVTRRQIFNKVRLFIFFFFFLNFHNIVVKYKIQQRKVKKQKKKTKKNNKKQKKKKKKTVS